MPDLKTTLRRYVDATVERVDVEDLAIDVVVPEGAPRLPLWRRPAAVAGFAAAAVLVLVGGFALLLGWGNDSAPIAEDPTTVATTASPTTAPPAATVPESTTLPPATTTPPASTTTEPATTTTQPASTPTTPQAVVTEMPEPTPDSLAMTWARVPHGPEFERGWMNAVTAGGPGLVAVGGDGRGGADDAAVWVSSDGTSWERIESESFSGEPDELSIDGSQFMADVISGPFGVVAVGAGSERGPDEVLNAAVWRSLDGYSWSRVSIEELAGPTGGAMHAVTAGGPGLVAVGGDTNPSGDDDEGGIAAVWVSSDGISWSQVDDGAIEKPDQFNAVMTDVIEWDGRLYAVGGADLDLFTGSAGAGSQPIVWASDDGLAWEIVFEEGQGWIDAIAATDDGMVAVGGTGDLTGLGGPQAPVAWVSGDGTTWVGADALFETVNAEHANWPNDSTGTDGRYLAVGHAAPDSLGNYYAMPRPHKAMAEVWGSVDGKAWYLVGDLGEVSRTPSRTSGSRTVMGGVVVVAGDVAVAVGSDGLYQSERGEGSWNCDVVYWGGWCRTDAAVWIGSFDD